MAERARCTGRRLAFGVGCVVGAIAGAAMGGLGAAHHGEGDEARAIATIADACRGPLVAERCGSEESRAVDMVRDSRHRRRAYFGWRRPLDGDAVRGSTLETEP